MESSVAQTATLRTDTTAPRRLLVVAGGVSLAAAAAGVLTALDVNNAVKSVIVPGIPGVLTAGDEALLYWRSSRVSQLKNSLRVGMTRAALPLAVTAILAILFFERAVLLLLGASGALTYWLGGRGDQALTGYLIAITFSALFVLLPMAMAMLFVARYMAHRIASNQLAWVLAVAVSVVALDIAILAVILDYYDLSWDGSTLTVVYAAMAILLLAAGTLGTVWARREDRSYVMKRLFSRLPKDEQETVIELVAPPS